MADFAENKRSEIRQMVQTELSQLSSVQLLKPLSRIAHYHYGRKVKLSLNETLLIDMLKKHRLNPHTVYRWFLLEYAPDDVKLLLSEEKISLKDAQKQSRVLRGERRAEIGIKILDEIRGIVKDM